MQKKKGRIPWCSDREWPWAWQSSSWGSTGWWWDSKCIPDTPQEPLPRTCPTRWSPSSLIDNTLELLHDHTMLLRAQKRLLSKSQVKLLDIVFWACISTMVETLNLFLDTRLSYSWREASMIVAQAQGLGSTRACSIRTWLLNFV